MLEESPQTHLDAFRALADSMPQLVWIAASSGEVDYYNARIALYAGATQQPDGSWKWQPLIHDDDLAPTMRAWQEAVASTSPYQHEHRIRMANGEFRWHLSRANPVRVEGHPIRWYGTATDIHEQKLALLGRDQLVSVISHDLRNPLSVIRVQAEYLRALASQPDAAAKRQVGIDTILRQTAAMTSMIDELLDVASLQAGHPLPLEVAEVDVTRLVKQVVDDHQALAADRELHFEVKREPPVVQADAGRLGRVVANLVGNALKYSPRGEPVFVEVEGSSSTVRISVRDRGFGITESEHEHIFAWYARGTSARHSGAAGHGIGLAEAKYVVEAHGGRIGVNSSEGKGSTFTIEIPTAG